MHKDRQCEQSAIIPPMVLSYKNFLFKNFFVEYSSNTTNGKAD